MVTSRGPRGRVPRDAGASRPVPLPALSVTGARPDLRRDLPRDLRPDPRGGPRRRRLHWPAVSSPPVTSGTATLAEPEAAPDQPDALRRAQENALVELLDIPAVADEL